ncbi:proton-conducting membrane transporter, partial [Mesorhizobium sp. M7A.F.Ca.CA.001.08.2.1]
LDRTRSERDRLRTDSDRLTGELDACGKTRADLERRLREASAAPAAGSSAAKPASQAPAALMSTPATAKSTKPAPAKPAAAKAVPAKAVPAKPAAKPAATKTSAPAKSATSKPATAKPASGSASGKPDNLRRLIGIGPVNEKLLKAQGVTSFAQIASWTAADIKRIEDVMNFDGRIARERWIEQAKLLAAGNEKEFAKQFPTAGTSSNS